MPITGYVLLGISGYIDENMQRYCILNANQNKESSIMLTNLIVATFKGIIEITLWLCLIAGLIFGAIFGYSSGDGGLLIGGLLGVIGSFLILAIFVGTVLILVDIHTYMKNGILILGDIRTSLNKIEVKHGEPPSKVDISSEVGTRHYKFEKLRMKRSQRQS
jgi:hypothetical protein